MLRRHCVQGLYSDVWFHCYSLEKCGELRSTKRGHAPTTLSAYNMPCRSCTTPCLFERCHIHVSKPGFGFSSVVWWPCVENTLFTLYCQFNVNYLEKLGCVHGFWGNMKDEGSTSLPCFRSKAIRWKVLRAKESRERGSGFRWPGSDQPVATSSVLAFSTTCPAVNPRFSNTTS